MPEYLAPGVYVEEVSFRAKTIEGVSTSTAGFVGPARFGPMQGEPELLTSFADFERIYGGLDPLDFGGTDVPNYLAHAVRAFFDEGGARLYVSRVANGPGTATTTIPDPDGGSNDITLTARYAGSGGNVTVAFTAKVGNNILTNDGTNNLAPGLRAHDTVYLVDASDAGATGVYYVEEVVSAGSTIRRFRQDGDTEGSAPTLADLDAASDEIHILTVNVEITTPGAFPRTETWSGLAPHPAHANSLSTLFASTLNSRLAQLTVPIIFTGPTTGDLVVHTLFGQGTSPIEETFGDTSATDADRRYIEDLSGGTDGSRPNAADYQGTGDDDPALKSGLVAFEDIEDISIVAAPGATYDYVNSASDIEQTVRHLISHCERLRYRVAVLDSPPNQAVSEIRAYRNRFDSKYAALYYPWVRIVDPVTNAETNMPPSGFVAGIYARNDIEHGVHKAPANEVVRGAIGFEFMLNKAQQDVLNPEGVNCFRFFPGRGYRLWGARTISSDPEWKYLNVRRYFAYLERSIDEGTQWVVFENNHEPLWANVRRTVSDFLFDEWKSGRLMGEKPEHAYFVRCDRTTMTQNDIDNGRLICLVGVASVRPAEFVIFRIGQWTADANA
nr:phage tail sheath subtilisin-like domain-containing protein [Ardenticatena sp.]